MDNTNAPYDDMDLGINPEGSPIPPEMELPRLPSKTFQKTAKDYFTRFARASADFIREKEDHWDLLQQLYDNKIGPREWTGLRQGKLSTSQSRIDSYDRDITDTWHSNFLYSPRHLIDMVVANVYPALFDGPDYLTVVITESLNINEGSSWVQEVPPIPLTPPEDTSFPVAQRVQELLKSYLKAGEIYARVVDIIKQWCLLGTGVVKTSWYKKTSYNMETGETETIEEYPVNHPIALEDFLPDPQAKHNDPQSWRAVGHRVDRTWDQIAEGFRAGTYNLNKSLFEETWQPTGGSTTVDDDDDTYAQTDETTWLTVWEIHGGVPTEDGIVECCASIITTQGAQYCDEGILIRLTETPVLESQKRPFALAHFGHVDGPLGYGLIDASEDLILLISQLICQIADNARITAVGAFQAPKGSTQVTDIQDKGGSIYPGMIAEFDPLLTDGIKPILMPTFDARTLFDLLSFAIQLLERRTVTETFQGVASKRQTATEASLLQQQSQRPVQFRTDVMARSLWEPMFNLNLGLVREMALRDQTFTVMGSDNQPVQLTVTKEDLTSHKFEVVTTMTRADSTRIAKAQSLERAIPMLGQMMQALAGEGWEISVSELVKRYLDLLGIEGVDRVLRRMSQEKQMQLAQQQMAMQQQAQGGPMPQGPNEGPPQPPTMEGGGPMGPSPDDQNMMGKLLQFQALQNQGGGM